MSFDTVAIRAVLGHCPFIKALLTTMVKTMTILVENAIEMAFCKRIDVDMKQTTTRTNWSTYTVIRPTKEPALGEGPYVLVAQKLVANSHLTTSENVELVSKLLAANDRALALLGGDKKYI